MKRGECLWFLWLILLLFDVRNWAMGIRVDDIFLPSLITSNGNKERSIRNGAVSHIYPYPYAEDTVATAAETQSCVSKYHTTLAKWQLASDLLIAIAYFSIPVELIYFLKKAQMFPYRGVIAQFGLFIVLCGLSHLLTLWSYVMNSDASKICITTAKVVTATVSCTTAILLSRVLPDILFVKIREEFLSAKTKELDLEVGNLKKEEEIGRHVRMLTSEIRCTLDRLTILNTTMVELARTLKLNNCTIWMPKENGTFLELSHELGPRVDARPSPIKVANDQTVQAVLNSNSAMLIAEESSLAQFSGIGESVDSVIAVRVPLYNTSSFHNVTNLEDLLNRDSSSFAVMALVLPSGSRRNITHELMLIEAVADQVAVALSHATILEESLNTRDQLIVQNAALQKARQEAESAIIARNEFLAVMNHEMRTPMHAIVALSSLLMEADITSEQRSMVDTIIKSSNLLSSLINDVLDFSRLENESLSLDPHPFDLQKLFTEAEKLLFPMANAKNLPLEMKLQSDLPKMVLGDSNRILQILLNLVGNSIKFTSEGHVHISVHASATGGLDKEWQPQLPLDSPIQTMDHMFVHIVVEDTGIGVKEADLPKLFKKFVQADSSITRKYGGTGLGLAITKKIVELMGGQVSMESEGLGKGTICKLYVRLGIIREATPNTTQSPKRARWDSITNLLGLKVLVVDDNAINRVVTRRLLDTIGCSSTVLESGAKCLKTLEEIGPSSYQVLLLDLCMPEMDGFTVAKEILARYGQFERPLIVALTANTDKRTREMCFEVGMDEIFMKPINLETLRSGLTKLLKRPPPFVVASSSAQ